MTDPAVPFDQPPSPDRSAPVTTGEVPDRTGVAPGSSPADAGKVEEALAAVTDGFRVLGRLLAGVGGAASGFLLALSVGGVAALAIGLFAWHATIPEAAVIVLLVAPCIVAPQVLRRRIGALVETATHPAEAASQARDLLRRVQPGGELRREVDRLRRVVTEGGGRRVRRAIEVSRATGGVLAIVEPDPERHRLLLPLRPERLARLTAWAWACLWSPLLAGLVTTAALVTLLVRAVS